jgi:uncharacterized membrane protein
MTDSANPPLPKPSQEVPASAQTLTGQQPEQALSPQQLAAIAAAQLGGVRGLPYDPFGNPFTVPGQSALLPGPQAQFSIQRWQGQFPPPEAVERYEKVLPGTFNRLIAMAETYQSAQIEETKRAQDYTQRDTRRGTWLGFLAMVAGIVGSVIMTVLHEPWVASLCLSVPVMGVAKALIDSARTKAADGAARSVPDEVAPSAPSPPANQSPSE